MNICNDLLKAAYTKVRETELVGNQVYDFWPLIAETLRSYVKEQIDITGSGGKAWEVTGPGLPRGEVTMRE